MRVLTRCFMWTLVLVPSSVYAQDASLKAGQDFFATKIRSVLAAHCFECHSKDAQKPKGNFRIDKLSADFAQADSRDAWLLVLNRVKAGDMPPKEKPRLSEKESQVLFDWINAGFKAADDRRAAEGRVVMRRLNRTEYENTVRDLLGVPVELKEHAADRQLVGRFRQCRRCAAHLVVLDGQISGSGGQGLEPGDRQRAADRRAQETLLDEGYPSGQGRQREGISPPGGGHGGVFRSSPWQTVGSQPFYPADRGLYRFRISASAFQSDGKPVTYRVDAGRADGGQART